MCVLNHSVNRTEEAQSAQIIMPSKHLKSKNNDIFISILSDSHQVTPNNSGVHLAIVSTVVETSNPVAELNEGIAQLGEFLSLLFSFIFLIIYLTTFLISFYIFADIY